jgi:integrase-like protein
MSARHCTSAQTNAPVTRGGAAQPLAKQRTREAGFEAYSRPNGSGAATVPPLSTGYALANKGTDTRTLQAYLGHRSIQSTVRYTELAPGRFKNLWR